MLSKQLHSGNDNHMGSGTQIGLPHALSVPMHDAVNLMQLSYTAGTAVVLYRALTAMNHYGTCTLCHVNSHYSTEKYTVIKGSKPALLSCVTASL